MAPASGGLSDLSIVLPFYNAEPFLKSRISSFGELVERGAQLVFVDDASDDGGHTVLEAAFSAEASMRVLRLEQNAGAGAARNAGFLQVERGYTLFLDIDDEIDIDALALALSDARAVGCEVQIAQYRVDEGQGQAPVPPFRRDAEIFAEAARRFSGACFDIRAFPALVRLTNYPWNKIVQTGFARAIDLRFGETRVQNDVLAHWAVLLKAQRISVVDHAYTVHRNASSAGRLSGDFGAGRLEMFDALAQVEAEVLCDPALRSVVMTDYLAFKLRLIRWARRQMGPEQLAAFERRAAASLRGLPLGEFGRFLWAEPGLALRNAGALLQRPERGRSAPTRT